MKKSDLLLIILLTIEIYEKAITRIERKCLFDYK